MTAANLIVRERAAYLLTDSATYRPDGTIIDLRPKVIASSELRMAICGNGEVWDTKGALIESWLAQQPSSDAAVAALPVLVAGLRADFRTLYTRHDDRRDCQDEDCPSDPGQVEKYHGAHS